MRKTNNNPPYTFKKRGIYYFSRLVPQDIRHHYKQARIVQSLRTRSKKNAASQSRLLLNQLDNYWSELRISQHNIPCSAFLLSPPTEVTLHVALDTYFSIKGNNRNQSFFRHTQRCVDYLVRATSDKPIRYFTTVDATNFRKWLERKGLANASIKRAFASIRAIFSLSIKEHGLAIENPFCNIHLPSPLEDAKRRVAISITDLKVIQTECKRIDDDIRWLIATICDTGMRLSEAVGLLVSDVHLDGQHPYVIVQPHKHRPLKTTSSTRIIPLVGVSLWGIKRALSNVKGSHIFPRYSSDDRCNSNSASAASNKWIKLITQKDYVIHGLRHSFRDRLRASEAPMDMIDQLGGWSLKTAGQRYGNGYHVTQLHKHMKTLEINQYEL